MISIINYGIGNVGSVANMLNHIGVPAELVSSAHEIEKAKALLLPGVGAFGIAMKTLRGLQLVEPIRHKVADEKVPILGICLGMQLLGTGSEEGDGDEPGFGFIDARFVRFSFPPPSSLKVPHMGWNAVSVRKPNPILAQSSDEQRFYFVHSYYAVCNDPADIIATARHGLEFTAAYGRDNIYGTQFHPEKSHKFGMTLLRNFAQFAC